MIDVSTRAVAVERAGLAQFVEEGLAPELLGGQEAQHLGRLERREPERQGEIWKRLALILLVLVLVETVLAWRFGAYSS